MGNEIESTMLLNQLVTTITSQLRTCGVVLHDDAGNRIRPFSAEEARIVNTIARNCAQLMVTKPGCQTPVEGCIEP